MSLDEKITVPVISFVLGKSVRVGQWELERKEMKINYNNGLSVHVNIKSKKRGNIFSIFNQSIIALDYPVLSSFVENARMWKENIFYTSTSLIFSAIGITAANFLANIMNGKMNIFSYLILSFYIPPLIYIAKQYIKSHSQLVKEIRFHINRVLEGLVDMEYDILKVEY